MFTSYFATEFLATNSSVEWSFASNGNESIIGTSHHNSKDGTFAKLSMKDPEFFNSIIEATHSHPQGSDESFADVEVGINLFPNEGRNVNFFIFKVPTLTYKSYSPIDIRRKEMFDKILEDILN